jgi:hypothetical protein
MARAIEQASGNGAPFARFLELGDKLVGAFAGGKNRQQLDFNKKTPKFKDNGKPMLEEIIHIIARPETTAKTGSPEQPEPINDGDHIRHAFSGFKWGQIIEARKHLPAHAGFKTGQSCSGDIYTIELVGWSAETDNPSAATKAGFDVHDGRIILRSQEDKDRYILAQSKKGGNTNPAKDFEVSVRRPGANEKRWEQAADELFDSKPWETMVPEPTTHSPFDEEPF